MKAKERKNKEIKFILGENEYELKINMNTFCELEETIISGWLTAVQAKNVNI